MYYRLSISIAALFLVPVLLFSQAEDTLKYLDPFDQTHLLDDYMLLLDPSGNGIGDGPYFYSHIWESAVGVRSDTEPAYFAFDGEVYKTGPNKSMEELILLNAANQISYRPISAGPVNYDAYYLKWSLDATEKLGLRAIDYGFFERLRLKK